MFFRSAEIEEELKCAFCKEKFTDVVKIVSGCGESICGECYEELKENANEKGEFKCKACEMSHKMPEDGLTDNRGLSRMLKRKKVEKPFSDEAKALKKLVETLPNQLDEIKAFDAHDYIHEYCDQLESEIIEEINSVAKLLNDIQEDLLKQTRKYRIQCLDALYTRSSTQSDTDKEVEQELQALTKEVDEFYHQWNDFFNQVEAYASDKSIHAALSTVNYLVKKKEDYDSKLKRRALNGQVMEFKASHSFFGKPNPLRKFFNLSIRENDARELKKGLSKVRTITVDSEEIYQVIFLSDEKLAGCCADTTIKVWNVDDGAPLHELICHTEWVNTLALLKNGWLASGSNDKNILIWDLYQGRLIRVLKGHTSSVKSLQALRNGNLASYAYDDTIRIWNPFATENNLLLTVNASGNIDWCLSLGVFSNDNLVTVSCEYKKECILRICDSKDGHQVKSVSTGLNSANTAVVLSNDQVAVGFDNGTIKIVDLADDSKSFTKTGAHEYPITALVQLSNDKLVSAAGDLHEDGSELVTIKIWGLPGLNLLQYVITDHSEIINSLSISPNKKLLASGSDDNTIKIWSLSAD